MIERKLDSVMVTEGGSLVGVVTTVDLLRALRDLLA